MFGSGNHHFRISISNLKQRRAFSLKCFLSGNVVADLNIKLLTASLSNKVDFLLIELCLLYTSKNAILKGSNLQEGATAQHRNSQIGGHRA